MSAGIRSALHDLLYRSGSAVILALARVRWIATPLTRVSKIWNRHARLLEFLRRSEFDQVVDGGANVGEFAAIVRAALPRVPLLCVEPHPGAARVLRRRGFRVIEAALWNEAGHADLVQPTAASTSSTLLSGTEAGELRYRVATARLDELGLSGRRILLKMDLQGAERVALEGLGDTWKQIEGLLLEVSFGPRGTYRTLSLELARRGFREAATFNELDEGGIAKEADKLWLRERAS